MKRTLFSLCLAFLSFASADVVIANANVSVALQDSCLGITGPKFVSNYRGCAWYALCSNNEVIREGRCPDGYRFNYEQQICDFRDNIECELDDRWIQKTCPIGSQSIAIIPHPYVCSKYTGNKSDFKNCTFFKHDF
jgi:Chitin binding Peritrophin-A domain